MSRGSAAKKGTRSNREKVKTRKERSRATEEVCDEGQEAEEE